MSEFVGDSQIEYETIEVTWANYLDVAERYNIPSGALFERLKGKLTYKDHSPLKMMVLKTDLTKFRRGSGSDTTQDT